MLRKVVYLSLGAVIFFAAWKFMDMRFIVQVVIVTALTAWVIIGGAMIGRKRAPRVRDTVFTPAQKISIRAAAERAAYVARYGEDYAARIDREDPRFWERVAAQPPVMK